MAGLLLCQTAPGEVATPTPPSKAKVLEHFSVTVFRTAQETPPRPRHLHLELRGIGGEIGAGRLSGSGERWRPAGNARRDGEWPA